MGQITRDFAETLLKRVKEGKHINTTVWEEEQLIRGWIYWHENYYLPRFRALTTPPANSCDAASNTEEKR